MKVYKVYPTDSFYGEYDGIVVVAENEERALEIGYRRDNSWSQYNNGGKLPDYTERHDFEVKQYPLKVEEIVLTKEDVVFISFLED